jgi:hypothetical protein
LAFGSWESAISNWQLAIGSCVGCSPRLRKIDRKEMMRALHQEHTFSDLFVSHLLRLRGGFWFWFWFFLISAISVNQW